MGHAKEMMMKYEARGYGCSNKIVCSDCVGNMHLKQFVIENGTENYCDFCKSENICVGIEDLCSEIMSGIASEYERAVVSMGWNSREGGYIGAAVWSTDELLYELNDDMELEDGVMDELINIIDDETWCKLDPYGLRKSEEQAYMWRRFSDMVKHETRYVFFRMPERDKYDEESDYLILDHIGNAVGEFGLIKTIPEKHLFFRGRTHKQDELITKVEDLCSPPKEHSKANRMSGEGISVFYCADNTETALAEIDYGAPAATVAAFENTKHLYILDLADTSKYSIPSLFDSDCRYLRESAVFLNKLNNDLTREITEMSAIEYVPAQVVAEYFRYLYSFEGTKIDGIAYSSSRYSGGICYVLFFSHS